MPDGLTPPIVSEELWDRANQRFETNRGEWHRNQNRPRLLRGRIRCASCGAPLYPETIRGTKVTAYRCANRRKSTGLCETVGTRQPRIRAHEIEEWAWNATREILLNPEAAAAEMLRRYEEHRDPTLPNRRATIEQRIRELTKQDQELVNRLAADPANDLLWKAFQPKLEQITKERTGYEAELVEVTQQIERQGKLALRLEGLVDLCRELGRELDEADFAERVRRLNRLGVEVVAEGAAWTMTLKVPMGVGQEPREWFCVDWDRYDSWRSQQPEGLGNGAASISGE